MSGLRETIRRRGGLELTSRVVGGLWVVGQRTVPEKPSPYNAAATAALMAAFPTQWPTIRDYGYTTPYLAAINAFAPEDPYIMYSLIPELGVIRWWKSNSNSYFKTNVLANNPTLGRMRMILSGTGDQTPCAARQGENRYYIAMIDGGRWCMPNGQSYNYGSSVSANVDYLVESELTTSKAVLKVNGSVMLNNAGTGSTDRTFYIFARNNGGNTDTITPANTKIAYVYFERNGACIGHFIPLKRANNNVECLDILTGTIAERVGSFTISETPAS